MASIIDIPPKFYPEYDELYVISDLHIGGDPGFQIFNSSRELVRLIEHLGALPARRRVALLINGDFVDFLAQTPATYFDPEQAVGKLRKIVEQENFAEIFSSLEAFVKKKNRFLIVNLGNHDLELALPWVGSELVSILTKDDEAARARFILSVGGAGFRCRVGNASVLCVHGNEVDAWNVADYETIRRIGRDALQGRPVDLWIPNGGSQLVIDVMNDLKHKYPFIDLLKPETDAVLPTLLALDPDVKYKIPLIAKSFGREAWDSIKRSTGFLGDVEPDERTGTGAVVTSAAGLAAANNPTAGSYPSRTAPPVWALNSPEAAEKLLDEAEKKFFDGVDPFSLIPDDQEGKYLGYTSAFVNWITGREKSEILREALEKLGEDKSFEPGAEDATFNLLDAQMAPEIDFLLAGHTHLERALKRKNGAGWYFNSGTWARLIKLEPSVLQNAAAFRKVFDAFKAGKMEALDDGDNLVRRILTVVAVRADNGVTRGELLHVRPIPPEGQPEIDIFESTGFVFTKN